MASMMGRSCSSYGVHLRSCLPSSSASSSSSTCNSAILSFSSKYTSSSTATSNILYFTGLSNSSCFLPRLSSSSFRTRRAKLFTATLPSSSSSSKEFRSRRFVHRVSASQEGNGSSTAAGSVCFPPPHTAQKDSSDMKESSSSSSTTTSSSSSSSSHINLLQGSDETSSSSSSLPSLFSAKLPRKATRKTSSKKNESLSDQVELTYASQEASGVTLSPAMSPRKVTRRVSTKEKENLPAETGLASTSEEASSQLLSAFLPKKITRKKKESALSPPTSSSTELSSAIDDTSSASVPKKVTRKRKKDESLPSESLSSFEDHSSETMLTSDGISSTKRVYRKKKDSTISQVSVSSDDNKELSSIRLEETSSTSVSTSLARRSRIRKTHDVSSEENQMKDPKISSSAILEEVLISPASPGRVSRKKKNDTLLSEVTSPSEVYLTSDGKITSSVLNEAPLSPKKVSRKNQSEGFLKHRNKDASSGAMAEKNICGDGNSAGSLLISPLMLSKKLPNKKETDYNVLAESSISSFADDLIIGGNIISPIKDEDTSPKRREERKKMQSITCLEDHLINPTIIEGKQGGISGENTEVYGEKILGKSSLMKGKGSLLDTEKKINLTSSNKGETDTSLRTVQNISSVISLQAPLEEKNLLPNLFELDDFMFSDRNYMATDDRTNRKLLDTKNSTKPTSISGSFKCNQPLGRELKKEDVNDMQHLNEKVQPYEAMNSQSKNAEEKTRGSENTMKEDHFKGTRMKDMSMPLNLGENEQNIEGRFYKTNRRSDLPNALTKHINRKDSIPLRREKFENQSARGRNERDTVERQEHVRSRMDGKSPSRVNDNRNKVMQYSYGNDNRAVKIIGRSNEKFGNQKSTMWRNNSRGMESFQESERYSQGGQYLVNTHRARGMDRKERKQFSVRNVLANQASTISYMQIYGTGFDTGDTVPTVFLFFDRRRFIFNVGEGLLRFCMEHRFKPSKIDHVFLTRVCSETTSGLPGLIFTLAELGESGMAAQTWGPANLQNLGKALRTFVPSGWLEHAHCFGPEDPSVFDCSSPIFLMEDELIKISAVLLYHEDQSSTDKASNVFPESEQTRNCRYDCPSTVYICELSEVKGKFDPAKALAKGLKPGYKYGQLQKGESVIADDGITMVHPDDVLGPSSPGPIMILVDCPSLSYLPSLVSSKGLQSYFSDSGKVVNCMVHITPISVTSLKEYQSWMENFKDTHHIMAYQHLIAPGKPTLRCSAATLSKLNFVCPQLFPMVSPESKIPQYENLVDGIKQQEGNKRMWVADNLLKFRFRPLANLGLDDSDVPSDFDPNISQTMEAIKAREISMKAFEKWSCLNSSSEFSQNEGYRVSQKLPPCLKGVSREEMEFIFLGTGSSQPSRHRNVTSIYVHLFKHGGILLDCGEGTYAQLKRRYGLEGADQVLMGLKLIWISHMHADHFTGLVRVLSVRRKLLEDARAPCERLLVIGPKQLRVFLDAYGAIEDLLMDFLDCSQTTFDAEEFSKDDDKYAEQGGNTSLQKKGGLISVPSENGNRQSQMQHYWMYPGFHIQQGVDREGRQKLRRALNSLGLKDLFSIPVVHCPNAFAVVIQAHGRKLNGSSMERGWKFVFSGDTRPCRAVIEAARGATILIHEATFDDGMLPEAIKKNHSITKEAIEVGVTAGVYRIFLTHFSQRYPAVPVFDTSHNNTTSIAFDMMTVNLADLPVVPEILPAFRLLFSLPPEDEDSFNL